jgi:hypothetical protein
MKLITKDGRLKLTIGQTIDHYFIVLFLLIVPALTSYDLYKIYVTKTDDGVRTANELIAFSFPFLILSVLFGFLQRHRLKFQEIRINYTDEQFQGAVKKTIEQLKWQIEYNENNSFRAYRPWNWSASWGEMITIIKERDRLLINSICDPNKTSSVLSWGWNKRNIEVFIANLTILDRDKID